MKHTRTTQAICSFVCMMMVWTMLTVTGFAQEVPQKISEQGYLTDAAGNPVNGDVQMTFTFYDKDGNVLSTSMQTVTVTNGRYAVHIPLTIGETKPVSMGITIAGDAELSPRDEMVSVPYALLAEKAMSLDGIWVVDGKVGIGEPNPQARLDVKGGLRVDGASFINGPTGSGQYSRVLRLRINGESPNFIDQFLIWCDLDTPYGIGFGGIGHNRGTIYAENIGGPDDPIGKIGIRARSNGEISLEGKVNIPTGRLTFNSPTTAGKAGIAPTDTGGLIGERDEGTETSRIVINIGDNLNDEIVMRTSPHSDSGYPVRDMLKVLYNKVLLAPSGGNVGIRTETPWAPLHIEGPSENDPGDGKAVVIKVNKSNPDFPTGLSIYSDLDTCYGLSFSGQGHGRAFICAENAGGAEDALGKLILQARNAGNIILKGAVAMGKDEATAALDVNGLIKGSILQLLEYSGGTWGENPGTLRWTGTDLEVYDGTQWKSMTSGSGGSVDWPDITNKPATYLGEDNLNVARNGSMIVKHAIQQGVARLYAGKNRFEFIHIFLDPTKLC